ncbi:hypothetical protein C8Q78DRAFT_562875 [Trametes maxima]|nr:hypothetical protein C8Q78DRAFT_562875 [Trametes maxima]
MLRLSVCPCVVFFVLSLLDLVECGGASSGLFSHSSRLLIRGNDFITTLRIVGRARSLPWVALLQHSAGCATASSLDWGNANDRVSARAIRMASLGVHLSDIRCQISFKIFQQSPSGLEIVQVMTVACSPAPVSDAS